MLGTLGKAGAIVGAAFIILAALSVVLPLLNEMYDPLTGTDPEIIGYSPPSAHHVLGTDSFGRDLFSQLCAGAYNAFFYGILRSVLAVPVLLCVAFVLAQLRSEPPQLKDTLLTRHVRFIGFPLCVVGLITFLRFFITAAVGRYLLGGIFFTAVSFAYLGWLAVGHELEMTLKKKKMSKKLLLRLLLTFVTLVLAYSVLYDGISGFYGLGDPTTVDWGMMLQWCFTSGYTFRAASWLFPPIICLYLFSRGMLALSYDLYNSNSENSLYFFKKGWV